MNYIHVSYAFKRYRMANASNVDTTAKNTMSLSPCRRLVGGPLVVPYLINHCATASTLEPHLFSNELGGVDDLHCLCNISSDSLISTNQWA